MGLKERDDWQEGMDEVEAKAGFGDSEDGDDLEDEGEDATVETLNEDEIGLSDDVDGEEGQDEDNYEIKQQKTVDAGELSSFQQLPVEKVPEGHKPEPELPSIFDGGPLSHSADEPPSSPTHLAEKLDAAKARMLANLQAGETSTETLEKPSQPTSVEEPALAALSLSNTKATVDMIITIAGEVYGQRDLLEFRSVWREVEP